MQRKWDVVVIGGGPAGISCASIAAEQGLEVLVLDEQQVPGGQIYRNIERQSAKVRTLLGKDYQKGGPLVQRFRSSGARYSGASIVWKIEHDGSVCFSRHGASLEVHGKKVVIATGAMERPVPFSGWTLPGVFGAGAMDAFFKSDGVVPAGPVTLVGSGPILLLVAGHLKKLGIAVAAVNDTTPPGGLRSSLVHLPKALRRLGYLMTGVGMLAGTYQMAGTYRRNITSYEALGKDRVRELRVTRNSGKKVTDQAEVVLVHEGIIPRTEFSRQLRLEHEWDPVQRYWYPKVDLVGRTSSANIFMAGDGAFVHGAVAAELKGQLTALGIVEELKASSEELTRQRAQLQKRLTCELLPRPFIDALYQPRSNMTELDDEVTVCRCEEVHAGTIRHLVHAHQTTPEMVKAVSRAGMGPCQGRMCGPCLSELIAKESGQEITSLQPLNVRPPVRNIGLAELATMSFLEQNVARGGSNE